jgi:transcriptional regulator of acetoin/glycerol metabolism
MTWETFKATSERQYLISTLRHCAGNISEAARVLAVERSTVHKWLKHHQIEKHHYT